MQHVKVEKVIHLQTEAVRNAEGNSEEEVENDKTILLHKWSALFYKNHTYNDQNLSCQDFSSDLTD